MRDRLPAAIERGAVALAASCHHRDKQRSLPFHRAQNDQNMVPGAGLEPARLAVEGF